jgi:hypothetical protein
MDEGLSKKEKIRLKHEHEQSKRERKGLMGKLVTWGIGLGVLLLIGAGVWWFVQESSKPLPGKEVADLGRDHIDKDKWLVYKYNSNPPTSGSHDPNWVKAGVYDQVQGVGYIVHSLEHGYIEISYNCAYGSSEPVATQSAVVSDTPSTGFIDATASAQLQTGAWTSQSCTDLKNQLTEIAKAKKLWKVIVMPWPTMESRIALTAWRRIDTFNEVDQQRINSFIDAFRDRGPEQTMEP